jgi:hypothetical protein
MPTERLSRVLTCTESLTHLLTGEIAARGNATLSPPSTAGCELEHAWLWTPIYMYT